MGDWHLLLRRARKALGLSRAELARRSGVSAETIRAYEDGRRRPSLQSLTAIVAALGCPAAEAGAIFEAAGFAPQAARFPWDRSPNYFYSAEELRRVVEEAPWPEFVLNESVEIIAANALVQALWGVDLAEEQRRRSRIGMNLLAVASENLFTDRVINWDESVAVLASVLKGQHPFPADGSTSGYLYSVLGHFASGDPAFLARLINVWTTTEPREPKCRWTYPVRWNDEEHGEMRFTCLVNTASEPEGLAFNDWVPLDAETWEKLERVKATRLGTRPSAPK